MCALPNMVCSPGVACVMLTLLFASSLLPIFYEVWSKLTHGWAHVPSSLRRWCFFIIEQVCFTDTFIYSRKLSKHCPVPGTVKGKKTHGVYVSVEIITLLKKKKNWGVILYNKRGVC